MKGQDLLLLLSLFADPRDRSRSYAAVGERLHLSASQVHAATKRLIEARLMKSDRDPRPRAVLEFVMHGMRYVFPVQVGGVALGLPTAWSAPPMSGLVSSPDVVVWPYSKGSVQGYAVAPLHRVVPEIASDHADLYELLALVDCLRIGRARERRMAEQELSARILNDGTQE